MLRQTRQLRLLRRSKVLPLVGRQGIAAYSTATTTTSKPGSSNALLLLGIGTLIGAGAVSIYGSFGSTSDKPGYLPRWHVDFKQHEPRKSKYASRHVMLQAVQEIRDALGPESVSTDEDDIEFHGKTETSTATTDIRPVAIVRPLSTEQVSKVVKICTKYKVPIVPYGAGTSVEGNSTSPYSGICVDVSEMNEVIAFHPNDMDVVVQPGVNWMTLNNEIQDSGLWLPLDPGPTASIGGMVSTNCSGTNATRYGTMKDYVMNLTVVLVDGSVIKTRHRPRKTSAGYNLTSLFVGSEGTLGIVTEVTLKLAIIPESVSVATASFASIKDAADAVTKMMRSGLPLAAVELMDDAQMKIINKTGGAGGRMWEEKPTLFLKFAGKPKAVLDDMTSAEQVTKSFGCDKFQKATTEEEKASLWAARKMALTSSLSIRPEGTRLWSTDVAVPISQMAELIDISKERATKTGLFNSVLGHVGDGNFHQMFMYNPDKESDKKIIDELVNAQIARAIELEGTVSGEHGIGLAKKDCLLKELGPQTVGLMKALKDTLDPHWLLNPGKVFDD